MDETELAKAAERGEKAERLLKDPMLLEAFDNCEAHIHKMFSEAPIRDQEGVYKARLLLHSLTLVRSALEQTLRDGKVAAKTLEDKRRGVSYLGDIWPSRRSRP